MPAYAEGSIREHLWTNLGPPMSTGVREDGIEGWLYKSPQFFTNNCKYFTVWIDAEFAFLQEEMRVTNDLGYCRSKEEVDLTQYQPDKPRSELIVRDKTEIEIRQ